MQPSPLQWTTTAQANASSGVKVLIYADSGQGKTVLCATAPKPVIISAESGLLSLNRKNLERLFGVNTPGITYEIPVIQVTNIDELTNAYNYFALDPSARQHFSTICIDSLSEIGEVVLANARKGNKDPRQAYGELIDKMSTIVRSFRDIPSYHVYMAAKMELLKDEASAIVKYMPSMPGQKLGPALPYFFDEVFRLYTNKTQQGVKYRALQTSPDLQYVAKDRSGVLDEMEKPDLNHIFNKILGANQ